MDYFYDYNLNENDVNEIVDYIDEKDLLEYEVYEENIKQIIDYLLTRKINIKELLMKKSYIFYTDSNIIIEKLNKVSDSELLAINDDIDLIDNLI